jgi:hypothetical protein
MTFQTFSAEAKLLKVFAVQALPCALHPDVIA